MYQPDRWKILKIQSPDETFYKIFAAWFGSFTEGSRWKLSSGFYPGDIVISEGFASIHQLSGSMYLLRNGGEGSGNSFHSGVYENFKNQVHEGYTITEVTLDFNTGELIEAN